MTNKTKMTMYAHVTPSWWAGEYWLSHVKVDGLACIGEVEVEFTPPEAPAIDAQAAIIDEAMGKVRAEMEERLAALEEEKRKLVGGGGE